MLMEDLDIVDDSFEIYLNANGGGKMLLPLMDEYPSPENTFDVMLGVDGEETPSSRLDPSAVASAVEAVGNVAVSFKKTELEKELKVACGRKPLTNKENKRLWKECADKFYKTKGAQYASQNTSGSGSGQSPNYSSPKPTSWSTEKKVFVGLGVVAILTVSYLVIKKMKVKKALPVGS